MSATKGGKTGLGESLVDERLVDLLEAAPALIAVVRGPAHVVEFVNARTRELVGFRHVVGKPVREAFPELEGQTFVELLDRVYDTGEPVDVSELRVLLDRRGAGTLDEAYLDFVCQPLRNAAGDVAGAYFHAVDVTERKRTEERSRFLGEASQLLASSLDVETTLASVAGLAVPRLADWCVVYLVDADGSIRRLAVEHSGELAPEVMAILDRHPLDPDADDGVPAVIRTGEPILRPELTLADVIADVADPDTLAAEMPELAITSYLCVPMVARGRTLGAISLLEGESARRFGPAELDLASELARRAGLAVDNALLFRAAGEQGALLDAVLASAPVAIGLWDRDLRYVRVNEALAALNNLPVEAHIGRTLREVVPDFADVLEPIYRRVIESGQPLIHEESTEMLAPRLGSERHWLSSYYPVRTPAGEVIGLGAVIMEITERKKAEARAQEAITLFEAQREASIDGVLVVAPDGRVLSHNQRFVEIWGLPEEALVRDEAALAHAVHKVVDPKGFLRRVEEVYADPVPSYDELALVDGRVIERYGAPVHGEDGTYYGYLWSFRDVTERRRSVEELKKLGSLVEASEDFVAMADLGGRLIYLNAAGRDLVGLRDDVSTTTVVDYTTPETWALWEAEGLPAMREHGTWSGQWMIRHLQTGEAIEVEGTVFVVRHPETGKALAFASVQRDIRERRRVERELEARAQAAEALEWVGDGVFLVDRDGVVRLWNPAIAGITGLPEAEVEGRLAAKVVPGWSELVERVPIVPGDARAGARWETLPLEVGGRERWLSISGVEFAAGTVFAVRDVTAERGLERLKSDFVSTVSHELRTPLAAIYGAALTLRRDGPPLGEDMRSDLLGVIADEADRLARIVNDILWTSRIESGGLRVTIESVNPVELATGVIQAAGLHVPHGIELALTAEDALPRIAADPDKVRQVLANLVDNAIKYSPDGGRIEVSLDLRGQMLRFTVRDHGLGIPAAESERVFEKFYRLDPDLTRGVGGTGLGLYICRELVRRMNGWIWIEPSPSDGTAVVVELPVHGDVVAHVF